MPPLELSWPHRATPRTPHPTMQLFPMPSRNGFCSCSDFAQLNCITLWADATAPTVALGDAAEDEQGSSPSVKSKAACLGRVGTWEPPRTGTGTSGNAGDPSGLSVKTPVNLGPLGRAPWMPDCPHPRLHKLPLGECDALGPLGHRRSFQRVSAEL